jgi:aspartate aminotransferase-like enzyme
MTTHPSRHRGTVRLATDADFEAIHRLNYRTFVEEIPQHPANAERRLVDRFHHENVYAVYDVDGHIAGMVSGRVQHPFSLEQKLGSLDAYLPAGSKPVEIRLLAVEPAHRASRVFVRLVSFITRHFMALGYDVGVISGTTRQLPLYRQLGCTMFGPLVGTPGAQYQPMYITAAQVRAWPDAMFGNDLSDAGSNFLPGPVGMSEAVRRAFAQPAQSHRAAPFLARYREVQQRLMDMTGARRVTLLLGSGTLANDVVGAQLTLLDAPGVVLSNGEFGDRLVDHAVRHGLTHRVVRAPWGQPFDVQHIEAAMRDSGARWLWAVHTETSTGVLNDLAMFKRVVSANGARLALDAISSIGTVPVPLDGVFMASAVSGKALSSYAGVAIVLHDETPRDGAGRIPRYLDLSLAEAHAGVPFTQSSNLLDALATSLDEIDWERRYRERARDGAWLRGALERVGLQVLAHAASASPAVHTIVLPAAVCARAVGEALRDDGILVSFESDYLRERGWLQVCLMGHYDGAALRALPRAIAGAVARVRERRPASLATVSFADASARTDTNVTATVA